MTQSSEFIRGFSEIIIMSILMKQDSYVYEIASLINKISKGRISISNPSTMVILKKMMADQIVSSYEGSNKRSVRRKYYKLTDKGKEIYRSEKNDYIETLVSMKNIIEGRIKLNETRD